jgi:hypothetical protein
LFWKVSESYLLLYYSTFQTFHTFFEPIISIVCVCVCVCVCIWYIHSKFVLFTHTNTHPPTLTVRVTYVVCEWFFLCLLCGIDRIDLPVDTASSSYINQKRNASKKSSLVFWGVAELSLFLLYRFVPTVSYICSFHHIRFYCLYLPVWCPPPPPYWME